MNMPGVTLDDSEIFNKFSLLSILSGVSVVLAGGIRGGRALALPTLRWLL